RALPTELRERSWYRAGDGARTRDPQLGRLMLYQLSYARAPQSGGGRIRTFVALSAADLQSAPFGRSGTPPCPPPSPRETSPDNRPRVSPPARLELGSKRVGGLEILGLTSLRAGCDAFCDPALERRIRGPLRGQDVEQGARNALERAKGRCRAPCPLRTIELAIGGPHEIEE